MINDKFILEEYLLVLKGTCEVYVHGTLESSNSDIRDILKHGLDETMKNQALTFDLMEENNFYQVNNIDKKAIKQVLNKIENI